MKRILTKTIQVKSRVSGKNETLKCYRYEMSKTERDFIKQVQKEGLF